MPGKVYPFTAVVDQERVKMALTLCIIDPRLGGVLITGPKGSGKSTIIRALEDILPETEAVIDCPFNCNPKDESHLCPSCSERLHGEGQLPIRKKRMRMIELPLGATEDGLLGTIDAEVAFQKGVKVLKPGLLGKANQNLLYIDDVNLLPDHLIDYILDPSVSGWNIVQREGLSLEHPSRFILNASMNPEEGKLRPQILDRFALKVEMDPIRDPKKKVELVKRNLSFEKDPESFIKTFAEDQKQLRNRIQMARESLPNVQVSSSIMNGIAEACSQLMVEGLRSDIAILKASRALAALEERSSVTPGDVIRVFDLGVTHRYRFSSDLTSERAFIQESLREIMLDQVKPESPGKIGEPIYEEGPEHISDLTRPKRIRRRRRLPQPLNYIIFLVTIVGLLLSLSVMFSLATLIAQMMLFNMPVELLVKGLTVQRVLIHLLVVAPVFFVLTILSRRIRKPVLYIYTYFGSGLRSQIVTQQSPMSDEERSVKGKVVINPGFLNVPLYASLRRLYKMMISKGAKLLEVGRGSERKHYKFLFERKSDRKLRGLMGKQFKTKARAERGRYVSYEFPKRRPWDVALGPTFRAAAPYQRARVGRGLALKVEIEDIRVKVREMQAPLTMVLLLDMSESMVASLVNVRNAILSMRDMAFKRRDRVGLVVFKGEGASILQNPTSNLNLVVNRLMEVGASDFTPLASGMYEAWRVLRNEKIRNKDVNTVLVIISDGIANIPLKAPLSAHTRSRYLNTAQADVIDVTHLLRREGVLCLVINPSHRPLGGEVPQKYKLDAVRQFGKNWLEPTELLMEIPKIAGGYYYGIGEGGELEQVILTEAFSILGDRA